MNNGTQYTVWSDFDAMPADFPTDRPTTLALGVFDGVHRGHRELLRRAVTDAHAISDGCPTVLTFDPNPARLTRPESYLGDLSTVEERLRLFAAEGVERTLLIQFSRAFLDVSGFRFLARLLELFPRLVRVVVGFNFHIGHNRDVHASELSRWMAERGVRVDIVPALKDNVGSISSSRIRRAVAAGDLEQVTTMLGRPYTVAIDGTLPSHRNECMQLLPSEGAYRCTLVDSDRSREGMMRVSVDGALTWEPRMNDIQYAVLRSTLDGIDS